MKRMLDTDLDDVDDGPSSEHANLFPCKRLRQLQSALGQRYEKRFVPSYPFHAALQPDDDSPDDHHHTHSLPDAPPRWLTHVAPDVHTSLAQLPALRTVSSRLAPARWEDSDAESDLDSDSETSPSSSLPTRPSHDADVDMDTGSSPSASPPPITPPNRVDFGFGFGFHFPAHGSAALKPGGRHAVVSCAHTVLCCAMCGVRVVRTMCEMGVQAQVDEDADESNSSYSHSLSRVQSTTPAPVRHVADVVAPEEHPHPDEDEDMDLEEEEEPTVTVRPQGDPLPAPRRSRSRSPPSSGTSTSASTAQTSPEPMPADPPPTVPAPKPRVQDEAATVSLKAPGPPPAKEPPQNKASSSSKTCKAPVRAANTPEPRPAVPPAARPIPKGPRALTALPRTGRPIPTAPAALLRSLGPSTSVFTKAATDLQPTRGAPSPLEPPTPATEPPPLPTSAPPPPPPASAPPPLPPPPTDAGLPPEPAALPPPLPMSTVAMQWSERPRPSPGLYPSLPSASFATESFCASLELPMFPPDPPGLTIGMGDACASHEPAPWSNFPVPAPIVPPEPTTQPPPPPPTFAPPPPRPPITSGPPEPLHPPPPLPGPPPPPAPGPVPADSAALEAQQRELARREGKRRKRERRRLVKREVQAGLRTRPAPASLPQRKEGHDFQCPIDCRWFTMVGFLGHFDMKHEGRHSMPRRVRDELIKQGDLPTFWRQFWAHCDLRPDEYHPAYARVDYDDLASASAPGGVDDMEDGEIPDHLPPQHLHQHPHPHPHAYQHQANTGRQPASVFGVKAP